MLSREMIESTISYYEKMIQEKMKKTTIFFKQKNPPKND